VRLIKTYVDGSGHAIFVAAGISDDSGARVETEYPLQQKEVAPDPPIYSFSIMSLDGALHWPPGGESLLPVRGYDPAKDFPWPWAERNVGAMMTGRGGYDAGGGRAPNLSSPSAVSALSSTLARPRKFPASSLPTSIVGCPAGSEMIGKRLRIIGPDQVGDAMFDQDRVTIFVDADDRIRRVSIG